VNGCSQNKQRKGEPRVHSSPINAVAGHARRVHRCLRQANDEEKEEGNIEKEMMWQIITDVW
jgi:hypothetical protein